jgi:hypothetical protein
LTIPTYLGYEIRISKFSDLRTPKLGEKVQFFKHFCSLAYSPRTQSEFCSI